VHSPEAELAARKRALRGRLGPARHALNDVERRAATERIGAAAAEVIDELGAARTAAYVSVGEEPGTGPLLAALRARAVTVLLPAVRPDGLLDWAEQPAGQTWLRGPFGLLEPAGPRLGAGALGTVELAFVPALAVDRQGRRLGRGGGYVDRALRRARPRTVLAVVYDHEVLDEVPAGPADEPVDGALRPAGVLWHS
jgi:5-formyltetrahydrofolate cyclo-ligase